MSKSLWPRLENLRVSERELSNAARHYSLSDTGFRALINLVCCCAASLVWTYSAPGDGALEDDDVMLSRIAGLSRRKWRSIRAEVAQYFDIIDGWWSLKSEWIGIDDQPTRFAIPKAIQRSVLSRSGSVCTYCGNTDGPFDLDHILPVSKGGENSASNLTVACAKCNRSKGAKTLREWFGHD